ncbi:MAG: DUF1549 domain-containing protein [Planctomycetaceae bacterium]|nr:DUF1549 domain-containing protein [Planctomycetales bacterium]MCB9921380.1 DUF1549 domain-containing protein [Planctomycetaceae bacterium]
MLLLSCLWASASDSSWAEDAKKLEFFETRIRPVLVEHCYECHSVGAKEVKGSLVVDTAAGMLKGGDSGASLVPGKPNDSLLIEALRYESVEMPPAGRLPEHIIRDFEKWIEMGAPDPRGGDVGPITRTKIDIEAGRQFWAFQPPQPHAPPTVADTSWPRSEIDAFVLKRLEDEGLKPASDADRATLTRRLYFDLLGLPPTPEQLRSFAEDSSPTALETLVDHLLESKQFGVHWGRHWLDVARYADSNGGDFNATFHNAWRYRDYVVDAMNDDKPFDQFVREQIAGDLLPFESDQQRAEQLIATGFLMIGTKMLSERDKEKLAMDVVDEQISTAGSAFMGLTLGCCRCHDHKFDPIPTQDYYALAGIFHSTRTLEGESQEYVSTWPRRDLPASADHIAAVTKHEAQSKALKAQLTAMKKDFDAAEKALKELVANPNNLTIDDSEAEVAGSWKASTYTPNYVGKGYIHDDDNDKGEKSVEFSLKLARSGLYEVQLSYTHNSNRANNVPVTICHADGKSEVPFDQTRKPTVDELFAPVGRFKFERDLPASLTISTTGTKGYVIVDAIRLVALDENGEPLSADPGDSNLAAQAAEDKVEKLKAELASLNQKIEKQEANAPPPLPKAIAVDEYKEIDDCEVCVRGEHRNRGERVPRGFIQVALTGEPPKISSEQSGRKELADWIANPLHPLTSRVIVNRIWSHLLGEGIVRSVDNFGELGERPTHPDLLDDLASRFARPVSDRGFGWSIKRIVREIALSRVYQMSSEHDEAAWRVDPENRLLWRANRRRLPAESIRDAMLAISGQLELTPGGSPVEGLGTLVTNNSADADAYERKETAKRSLYLPIIRNELPPTLTVFDFADPDLVVGKRPVTNVPAQALLLMNSPFVMNCAERTAERLLAMESQSPEQIAAAAYQVTVAREPTIAELERAVEFLHRSEDLKSDLARKRLTLLVHVLFASTEFRMLN